MTHLKTITAALLMIGVAAGGTAVLAFQQATTEKKDPEGHRQGQEPPQEVAALTASPLDDVNLLKARIETKRAELKRVDARVALAELRFEFTKKLQDKHVISEQEMRLSEAEFKIAEAERPIKEAEIQEIEVLLRRAIAQQSPSGDPSLRRLALRFADLESRLGKVEQKLDQLTRTIEARPSSPRP